MSNLLAFEMSSERLGVAIDSQDQENEHSCFSDTTHLDFLFNLQGVMNVYFGIYQDYSGEGLQQLLQSNLPQLDKEISREFKKTQQMIMDMPAPFDRFIAESKNPYQKRIGDQIYTQLFKLGNLLASAGKALGAKVIIATE